MPRRLHKNEKLLHQIKLPVTATRVWKYDPEIVFRIALEIASGKLLKDIHAAPDMPSAHVLREWTTAHPEAARAIRVARELSAQAFEEEAIGRARELAENPGTTQKIRATETLLNQLRWSATRRNPKEFGETGMSKIVVPVHISTPLNLGEVSTTPMSDPNLYTIEAKMLVPADPDTHEEIEEQAPPLIPIDAPVKVKGRPKGYTRQHLDQEVLARTPEEREAEYQAYLERKAQKKHREKVRRDARKQSAALSAKSKDHSTPGDASD